VVTDEVPDLSKSSQN